MNSRLALKQTKHFTVTNKWRQFPPKRNLTTPTHAKSSNIEHIQCNIEQSKIDGDENLDTKSDEETSEESEYSISGQSEAEYLSNNESRSVIFYCILAIFDSSFE